MDMFPAVMKLSFTGDVGIGLVMGLRANARHLVASRVISNYRQT